MQEQQQQSSAPSQPSDQAQAPPLSRPLFRVTLQFEDVEYKIKINSSSSSSLGKKKKTEKALLKGVSGSAGPGQMLGMLGPSGSGKTTLLNALGGRLGAARQRTVGGKILYNGKPVTASLRRRTAFVMQEDILYPHLTVADTLMYAALLRLPRSLSTQAKAAQVAWVISELGLGRCAHTPVGGPLSNIRGVSGGERRRVSIGHELLTNPSIVLLDEPTSGLDSTAAQRLVLTLRGLCSSGRTVVTTIHQPSSRVFFMMDLVLLLCEGSPVYFGPSAAAMDYFNSIGFSPAFPTNPADFLLDLANGLKSEKIENEEQQHGRTELEMQKTVKQQLISEYNRRLSGQVKYTLQSINTADMAPNHRQSKSEKWSTTWTEQFWVLLRRSLKERRHEAFSALRLIQVVAIAVLTGLIWWHSTIAHIEDQVGLLFFIATFWGFFPLFNAIFAFPQERAILKKERSSSMYRLSAYFMARIAGDLPMELLLPIGHVTVCYWMGGLKPQPLTFIQTLAIILFSVLVAQGMGLALGAALMDTKKATTMASVIMLAFLLAGGYYVHKIPAFLGWLKYVSFSYYGYKLLLTVQYQPGQTYPCTEGICRVEDFVGIRAVGLGGTDYSVAVLTLMMIFYRALAYLGLKRLV